MLTHRLSIAIFIAAGVFACSSDQSSSDQKPGTGNDSNPINPDGTPKGDGGADSGGGTGDSGGGGKEDGGSTITPEAIIPSDSVWRTTSEWYRAIETAPVAEHSNQMIGALTRWGTSGIFQIDFSFNVLDGAGATKVNIDPQDEADDVAVPIPAKGYIEGDNAYNACPDDEDCHLVVVDRPAHRLYEVYQAHRTGNTWAGFVALWKLDKTYPRDNRGLGCTSAEAAGLAIAPGLIGYKETKKGNIEHALRFIIRNDYIRGVLNDRDTPNVVYPGSHGSTKGKAAGGIPYGGRLRLKSTVTENDPRVKSPGAKAIVRALHRYGMILADGGSIPLTAESVRVHADADPSATWNGILAARDLGFIQPSDFEVVGIPKENPSGAPGWYSSRVEYEAQLKKPLGCVGVRQP